MLVEYVEDVAPGIITAFLYHWYVGEVPACVTDVENETVLPEQVVIIFPAAAGVEVTVMVGVTEAVIFTVTDAQDVLLLHGAGSS